MKKKLFLVVGALALGACLGNDGPTASDPTKETFAASLGVNLADMKQTTSGTYYKDLTVGTGAALSTPTATTKVTVDYTGSLKDGTQFDAATGAQFALGGVIYGFVDGMFGMAVGGERLIVIPSDLGYGAGGNPPKVPGNATLVFRIKLKSFQ